MAQSRSARYTIASRYAGALFDLAQSKKAEAKVGEQLKTLSETIASHDELRDAIHSPLTSKESLANVMEAIAKQAKCHALLISSLPYMAKHGRATLIPAISEHYQDLLAKATGMVRATATTAHALDPKKVETLEAELSKATGQTISLETEVDESIIGGMVLLVNSKMLDYSVKGRLNLLKHQLNQASL